jgi:hypothetical protein
MTGSPANARTPRCPKSAWARVRAQIRAVKLASDPPVVKWPVAPSGSHVRFELDRHRGCGGGRELRVERGGDAIGAFGGKAGLRIEQSAIARMGEMHDAVLELFHHPWQQVGQIARGGEIESGEVCAEVPHVERRADLAIGHAGPCVGEQRGQRVIELAAPGGVGKQR